MLWNFIEHTCLPNKFFAQFGLLEIKYGLKVYSCDFIKTRYYPENHDWQKHFQ